MLKDLLNCLRGRAQAPTVFLGCGWQGDPFRKALLKDERLGRGRGANIGLENILRSRAGDSAKHSDKESAGESDELLESPPDVKALKGFSGLLLLRETVLVENPLVRDRDGRRNFGFGRLRWLMR